MYRHGDLAQALLFGFDLRGLARPATRQSLAAAADAARVARGPCISLVASPLMHGTGLLGGAFAAMNMGGTIVTLPGRRFDPDALWRAVERECVTDITIVGDVFAKPMLAALRDARAAGRPYDVSSVRQLFSSGTMFSIDVKRSEEHTSELQSLMRNSYAVLCLKKKTNYTLIYHLHHSKN